MRNDTAGVLVMVSGASKHGAVQHRKRGEDPPIARIHGHAGIEVYIDKQAETRVET